jgi:hypothetical protein
MEAIAKIAKDEDVSSCEISEYLFDVKVKK